MLDTIFVERPFDFAKHSTIGCGGFARVGYYPKTDGEVKVLLSYLKNEVRNAFFNHIVGFLHTLGINSSR